MIVSSLVFFGCASTKSAVTKETTAKETTSAVNSKTYFLEDEQGQATSLELGLKPQLISFTSTWCGSCQKHRKDFHRIYNNYEKKGVQFYFIRVGEVAKDVRADLDAEKAPHKHYFDKEGKVSEAFKVDTTPTILVYDKNGNEIYRSDVYSEEEIQASLNTVLK